MGDGAEMMSRPRRALRISASVVAPAVATIAVLAIIAREDRLLAWMVSGAVMVVMAAAAALLPGRK